jgi:hypothetical protein
MIGIILIIVVAVGLLVYIGYRNDIRKAYERIAADSQLRGSGLSLPN